MAENNENTTPSDASHDSSHSHGHKKASYDDINTTAVIIVGLISALFTFLTIAFVQGLYYQWNNSYVRARSTNYKKDPVTKIVDAQKEQLLGEAEGTISIEKAMEKVLAEYGSEEH